MEVAVSDVIPPGSNPSSGGRIWFPSRCRDLKLSWAPSTSSDLLRAQTLGTPTRRGKSVEGAGDAGLDRSTRELFTFVRDGGWMEQPPDRPDLFFSTPLSLFSWGVWASVEWTRRVFVSGLSSSGSRGARARQVRYGRRAAIREPGRDVGPRGDPKVWAVIVSTVKQGRLFRGGPHRQRFRRSGPSARKGDKYLPGPLPGP